MNDWSCQRRIDGREKHQAAGGYRGPQMYRGVSGQVVRTKTCATVCPFTCSLTTMSFSLSLSHVSLLPLGVRHQNYHSRDVISWSHQSVGLLLVLGVLSDVRQGPSVRVETSLRKFASHQRRIHVQFDPDHHCACPPLQCVCVCVCGFEYVKPP